MSDVKSTTIVPIGFYCFTLSLYCLSFAINSVLSNKTIFSSPDFLSWLPALSATVFAVILIPVGVGILKVDQMSWKLLFFTLAICVTSVASLLIAFLICLMISPHILSPYSQYIQTTSVGWFCFLGFFLSEIIVMYYLCSSDVVTAFGDMGPLLTPF